MTSKREEQRDAEAGLLDGGALGRADGGAAPEVEEAADPAGADVGVEVAGDARAGDGVVGAEHGELAELLGERHPGDEAVDPARGPGAGRASDPGAGGDQREDAAAVGAGGRSLGAAPGLGDARDHTAQP